MDLNRWQFNEHVAGLAAKDPAFRAALLTDPQGALARILEEKLPESLTIRVVEEIPNTMCIVIPQAAAKTDELTGQHLAQVVGGVIPEPLPKVATLPDPLPRVAGLTQIAVSPLPIPNVFRIGR
jgi:hypothetical protein